MTSDLLGSLRQLFGLEAFRPGQAEAIQHVLAGRHTLVIMPTGAGKSLVYQLAGLSLPGVTLVISPLIALMKDQVDSLTRRGIPAVFINSTLSGAEQANRLQALLEGAFRLAYVAPERLRSFRFQQTLRHLTVSLLAVDEAHCLSQWGHDFRPDYLHIAAARAEMGAPVTVALTATATLPVQDEVIRLLGLPSAERVITGYNRPNLTFEVLRTPDVPAKLQTLRALFAALKGGAAIVYVATRHDAEEVAAFAREVCGVSARHYHAGLEVEPRKQIQEAFIAGDLPVVVATNAFGLGIDRADVRLVAHFSLPANLETYYQEAGRAGRDGLPARAVLLYASGDCSLQEWFIENSMYAPGDLRRLDQALRAPGRAEAWWTVEELAQAAGLSVVKVKVGLARLEAAGAVQRLGDAGWSMLLRLGRWDESAVEASAEYAHEQRKRRQTQLAQMIAYAESIDCRRRRLLDHFGEDLPAPTLPCCDNCLSRRPPWSPPATAGAGPSGKGRSRLLPGLRSLAARLLSRLARWFLPPVSQDVVQFLQRTDPQLLSGPWQAGCALGLYQRFGGVGGGRTLLGSLIYRLKYGGDSAALPLLVNEVLRLCAEYPALLDVDALVPMPPSRPRLLDPVGALAEALGRQTGHPVWPVLARVRPTSPQKALRTRAEKRTNVAGALAVQVDVRGQRLLVLDDVYDSGATLEEAARVLHSAGAARLCVLTLARTHKRNL